MNDRLKTTVSRKNEPILVQVSVNDEVLTNILKHRHLTKIPTSAHIRELLKKDMVENPQDYGISTC